MCIPLTALAEEVRVGKVRLQILFQTPNDSRVEMKVPSLRPGRKRNVQKVVYAAVESPTIKKGIGHV